MEIQAKWTLYIPWGRRIRSLLGRRKVTGHLGCGAYIHIYEPYDCIRPADEESSSSSSSSGDSEDEQKEKQEEEKPSPDNS